MHVRIGILSNRRYPGKNITVAAVAAMNEFGHDHTPPRPFMRNTMRAKYSEWRKILLESIKAGYSKKQALQRVGLAAVADIKETIENGVPPPSALATVRHKQRLGLADPNHTLVETALMQESITYELE